MYMCVCVYVRLWHGRKVFHGLHLHKFAFRWKFVRPGHQPYGTMATACSIRFQQQQQQEQCVIRNKINTKKSVTIVKTCTWRGECSGEWWIWPWGNANSLLLLLNFAVAAHTAVTASASDVDVVADAPAVTITNTLHICCYYCWWW